MHILQKMINERAHNNRAAIYSACTASPLALEAVFEQALEDGSAACVEATANQVNQFGGYTGMRPRDFANLVYSIAEKIGFPRERIILGGDHLGPLTWRADTPEAALEKSAKLVSEYVSEGFSKIHIDTSMTLGGDTFLNDEIIAGRAVELFKAAENAAAHANVCPPVYIIGSEVPIPGGALEDEEMVSVTRPESFEDTYQAFRREFEKNGLMNAWERVIGVVVQPGVEFSDTLVHEYSRENANVLTERLKKYPGIVFEGHSTDYQTTGCLRQMIEDGIAILKVGPALTFAQRECMFALSRIEDELLGKEASGFIAVLDKAMLENPANWEKHYVGTESERAFKRKYSYADRCRYYLSNDGVKSAYRKMRENLEKTEIPLSLVSQYLPRQYRKIRENALTLSPDAIIKDYIRMECISLYTTAING